MDRRNAVKIKDFRFPEEETPNSVKSGGYFFLHSESRTSRYFVMAFNSLTCCWKSSDSTGRGHKSLVVFPMQENYGLVLSFSVDVYRNMVSVVPVDREERLFPGENTDRRHRCFLAFEIIFLLILTSF